MESRENVLSSIQYWISVGETLQKDLAMKFYELFPSSCHTLYNLFGTTEHGEFLLHQVTESDLNCDTRGIPLGTVISLRMAQVGMLRDVHVSNKT